MMTVCIDHSAAVVYNANSAISYSFSANNQVERNAPPQNLVAGGRKKESDHNYNFSIFFFLFADLSGFLFFIFPFPSLPLQERSVHWVVSTVNCFSPCIPANICAFYLSVL